MQKTCSCIKHTSKEMSVNAGIDARSLDEFASKQLDMLNKLDRVLAQESALHAEHSSATQQASMIRVNDLRSMMNQMKCRVAWQPGDPDFGDLLGAPPEEGGWWYFSGPTVSNMPLQASDEKGLLLPCLKRTRQLLMSLSQLCQQLLMRRTELRSSSRHAAG